MRTPSDGAYHRMTNADDEDDSDFKKPVPSPSDENSGRYRQGKTAGQRSLNVCLSDPAHHRHALMYSLTRPFVNIQDEHNSNPPLSYAEKHVPLLAQKAEHPLFERPDLRSLAVYGFCCALVYPVLYVVTLICNGRSLFEVRLFVGLGCTVVSFVLGLFLLKFARRFIEASSK